jgi:hypothetical protein
LLPIQFSFVSILDITVVAADGSLDQNVAEFEATEFWPFFFKSEISLSLAKLAAASNTTILSINFSIFSVKLVLSS